MVSRMIPTIESHTDTVLVTDSPLPSPISGHGSSGLLRIWQISVDFAAWLGPQPTWATGSDVSVQVAPKFLFWSEATPASKDASRSSLMCSFARPMKSSTGSVYSTLSLRVTLRVAFVHLVTLFLVLCHLRTSFQTSRFLAGVHFHSCLGTSFSTSLHTGARRRLRRRRLFQRAIALRTTRRRLNHLAPLVGTARSTKTKNASRNFIAGLDAGKKSAGFWALESDWGCQADQSPWSQSHEGLLFDTGDGKCKLSQLQIELSI